MSGKTGVGTEDTGTKDSRKKKLGKQGEDLAVEYLTEIGLTVLSRNWRCREGELDVVATDGNGIVVCEVKTRSGAEFGAPAESVTPVKIERIRRLTNLWLAAFHVSWCAVRFDVVAVLWPPCGQPEITHFRGVF